MKDTIHQYLSYCNWLIIIIRRSYILGILLIIGLNSLLLGEKKFESWINVYGQWVERLTVKPTYLSNQKYPSSSPITKYVHKEIP